MGGTSSTASHAPLVFLDVDGVLNSRHTRAEGDDSPHPELIARIARIVHHKYKSPSHPKVSSHGRVVLSSTWRLNPHHREQVRAALSAHGVILDASDTPDLEGLYG